MDVSIVTPSLNMRGYLRRCHASIVDQAEVRAEHVVVDGGSRDGTREWLRDQPSIVALTDGDEGMYDAVNQGMRRARGNVLAYLNCDEQYLPGTLALVHRYFREHPTVDVVAGDTLLIRPDGSLIAYRRTYPLPRVLLMAGHLHIHSSSLFFRRRVVEDGNLFNPRLKDVGDYEFVLRLMNQGYRFGFLHAYFSAFTMTGSNRQEGENARVEGRRVRSQQPALLNALGGPLRFGRWMVKAVHGGYYQRTPLTYAVYATDEADARTVFSCSRVSFRWRTS